MLPENVRAFVETEVARFNRTYMEKFGKRYVTRYRGNYVYFDLQEAEADPSPICRLKYTGDLEDWEFAVFSWSDERYDPEEWMFPGSDLLDGTIDGALKAGYEAYM